jgi:hypothetical protein
MTPVPDLHTALKINHTIHSGQAMIKMGML